MKYLCSIYFIVLALLPTLLVAQENEAIRLIAINSVSSEGKQQNLLDSIKDKQLEIHYDQASRVSFGYQTRVLEEAEEVKYTLEGFETGWNEETSGSIDFTNLDAGDYQLRIGIFKGEDIMNEYILPFSIQAAYWQSTWYQLIIVLLVISVARYMIKLRAKTEKNPYTKGNSQQR